MPSLSESELIDTFWANLIFVSVNEVLGDSFGTHILSNQAGCARRGLVGEIIRRFEAKGFTLVGLKFMTVSRELEQHYDVHRETIFYWAGSVHHLWTRRGNGLGRENVVAAARKMIGATNPLTAETEYDSRRFWHQYWSTSSTAQMPLNRSS